MAINYTSAGGIFTTIGKLVKKVNAYYATGATTYPADENEIATAFAGGSFNDLIGSLTGPYSNGQSAIASLRSSLAAIANQRLLESDVVTALGLTNVSIANVLAALIPQMTADAQSVQNNNVAVGTVTAGGSNTGSGSIFISPILDGVTPPMRGVAAQAAYAGLTSELPIPETMTVKCSADSYTDGRPMGSESFQISGPVGQSNVWGTGAEGSGSGPSFNTLQAGTILQNMSFDSFSGSVPSSWTADSGASLIAKSTSTTFLGPASVQFTGDGSTATIQISQAPTALKPLKRYCFVVAYKATVAATPSQSILIQLSGTGYTPGPSEKILIPGGSWATTWTLASFFVNVPATLPSDLKLLISVTGTLPGGTSVFFDNAGFDAVTFENGLGFAASTGATPFVRGDKFMSVITNDLAGLFQVFFRRQFGVQLPSSGSPTIANSLAS